MGELWGCELERRGSRSGKMKLWDDVRKEVGQCRITRKKKKEEGGKVRLDRRYSAKKYSGRKGGNRGC